MSAQAGPDTTAVDGLPGEAQEQLLAILKDYMAELEAGLRPDPESFLARAPGLTTVLKSYLENVTALHRTASEMAPAAHPLPTNSLGEFDLVREVGRGGMGVVYEAVQRPLGRRVALKVLPAIGALDEKQVRRFKSEAQAAARLEHPGIVPIYAVGCENGVHYYAMQFIDGCNLAVVIDRLRHATQPVATKPAKRLFRPPLQEVLAPGSAGPPASEFQTCFREIAELGIQAAEALHHAHERGVLHRDIKPANLLVDQDRRVWITDFGLARLRGGDITTSGELAGTLRYLSPERILGQPEAVDARSDVYSLGVTLYELLTLQPAFPGAEQGALLQRITTEEPVPLSDHDPAIPVELQLIVQKAMAKDPAERYPTAAELAADLNNWIHDRPIRAERPSASQRAVRYLRRHWRSTALAASLLFVAGLLAASGAYLRDQQQQSAIAREVERQERLAQSAEQARLQTSLALTLSALDEGLVKAAEQRLPRAEGDLAEQQKTLLKGLQYYDRLAAANRSDPGVRCEAARVHWRVGDIEERLGEYPLAEQAYRRAIELLQPFTLSLPNYPELRRLLADCHHSLALLLWASGRSGPAETELRDELALLEQDWRIRRHDANHLVALAAGKLNFSLLLSDTGRRSDAEGILRELQPLLEEGRSQNPENAWLKQYMGTLHNQLGILLEARGDAAQAEHEYRAAIRALEPIRPDSATMPDAPCVLGWTYHNLGVLLRDRGRFGEALSAHQQARQIRQRLTHDFPAVPDYQKNLACGEHQMGYLLESMGRTREAEQEYRAAIRILEKLAAKYPGRYEYRKELGIGRNNLAVLLAHQGRADEAEQVYLQAVAGYESLVEDCPRLPEFQSRLGAALHNLALLLIEQGDADRARQLLQRAIRHQEAARQANPTDLTYQRFLEGHREALSKTRSKNQPAQQASTGWSRLGTRA